MVSTYTPNLHIEKPGFNDYIDTWDVPINADWDIVDKRSGGIQSVSLSSTNVTLTQAQCQNVNVYLTGVLTANVDLLFPSGVAGFYILHNNCTGSFTVTAKSAGGGAQTVLAFPQARTLLWTDGTNMWIGNDPIGGSGITILNNRISLTVPVTAALGGTGQTTLTANNVILGNGTSAVQFVAPGTSGNVLTSNGTTWASSAANFGKGAGVRKTAAQSIPSGTDTALTWATAYQDTSSVFSISSPTRLTVPAGVTQIGIGAGVVWGASNGSGVRNLYIKKNGALFYGDPNQASFPGGHTGSVPLNCSGAPLSVTAGDYFEVFAGQNSGAAVDISASEVTWFAMSILR